jgi:hypothetical protein
MQAGTFDGVSPAEAAAGLTDARSWLEGAREPRLGSGLIKAKPLNPGAEWLPVWVAITDGERAGAIMITLNGPAAAAGTAAGEDPAAHIVDRFRTESNSDQRSHFDQAALSHPIRY